MTTTSVCCRITDKHIFNHFFKVLRSLNWSCCHSLKSMHIIDMQVCRFKHVHFPCPCGQLFVRVFPPSPMLRYCAICNRAWSQEAHTREHTWLITTRQQSLSVQSQAHAPPQNRNLSREKGGKETLLFNSKKPWAEPSSYGGPIKSAREKKWGGKEINISYIITAVHNKIINE